MSPLVDFLRRELARDCATPVEIIETHISWVFLTDRFAYKLKKPVAFDFLDFRTPELRRAACDLELRLNRRLAADVYLAVLPVSAKGAGDFEIDGSGTPIDWLVKMRRLPADRTLDRLFAAGPVAAEDVARLAARLAAFYRDQPSLAVEAAEYRRQIAAHVRANLRDLKRFAGEFDPALVVRVHGAQLQFLSLSADVFDARVEEGRIVEGHGDLRPEHVYLLPEPVVLDCIEFNAEFRRLDIADELGFLAMECDRLGAAEIGDAVLRLAAAELHDDFPPDLLAFYKSYRACVRGKVAALRGEQHTGDSRTAALEEARKYLELAAREAMPLMRPLAVVIRGLSGSGKSTLAAALAERWGAEWLSTDVVRKELAAADSGIAQGTAGRYSPERRAVVYDQLFSRAEQFLHVGRTVVLDGTFLSAELCTRAAAIAENHRAQFLAVECQCPAEVARERIAARLAAGNSPSEAFPELPVEQQRLLEPIPENLPQLQVDTTTDCEEIVVRRLRTSARLDTEAR